MNREVGLPEAMRILRWCSAALLVAGASVGAPAIAQVGASISIANDARLRGYSISAERPVGSIALSYDDDSGLYAGVIATGVATAHAGAQLLDVQNYGGFTRRIGTDLTLDLGLTDSRFTSYSSMTRGGGYTELYAGVIANHVSSHLRYSPAYFDRRVSAFYLEVDGVTQPLAGVSVTGHVGLLDEQAGRSLTYPSSTRLDWRVGTSTSLGRYDVQLAWTGTSAGSRDPWSRPGGRSGWIVSLRRNF